MSLVYPSVTLRLRLGLGGRKRPHPFGLLRSIDRLDPFTPVFRKQLRLGLQHGIMKSVIVDDTPSHEPGARRKFASTEHECTAGFAKRVGHAFTGTGRFGL